jgi:hypothetical protein
MTQRDTLTPLCKIMLCGSGTVTEIPLMNAAVRVEDITFTSATNSFNETDVGAELIYPTTYSYNVSNADTAYLTTSATFEITTRRDIDGNVSLNPPVVTQGGVYSAKAALAVSGNGSTGRMGTPSGTFVVNTSPAKASVPYVTVTDVSGTEGWFRVWPGSGTGVYASATALSATVGEGAGALTADGYAPNTAGLPQTDTSGHPGVIGMAGTTVTLTLQPGQSINTIHLENHVDSPPYGTQKYAQFVINYGVIKNANPLRDQNLRDIV